MVSNSEFIMAEEVNENQRNHCENIELKSIAEMGE
jgi:hypothetical protein